MDQIRQTLIYQHLLSDFQVESMVEYLDIYGSRIKHIGRMKFLKVGIQGIATHSSIFAWRIPQTKEPGGLQSMGLQ